MLKPFLTALLLLGALTGRAQSAEPSNAAMPSPVPPAAEKMPLFEVRQPDRQLSPFTGMTRRHWQDAARYLLTGAFSYVHRPDDPMQFPKQPGKSYPRNPGQVPTEKLEGLCRTLFIAAPLLREEPELTLNGLKVADYYRHQIGLLVDPNSPSFIKPRAKNGGPSQILVEFGALGVSLFAAPEVLWDPLPQAQKDALAATMLSYGDGPTVGSNWKFFNIFVLSFFQSRGYPVNTKLLEEYLQKSLAHYRGEGWYNDAPAYDYYSMWAFQMYGTLWSEFYGRQHYPQVAAQFARNFAPVKDNYPYMFSRDGQMIMWGRSISYRFGAIIPFPLTGLQPDASTNYGWLRRISSGVLLQFLQNPAYLQDNVPTLGFYGAFEPAVQPYSCRGSAYWAGKAFLALLVPPTSPFWTATENEGPWATQELKPGTVLNKFQPGSELLLTDYPNLGAAEVRSWCHVKAIGAGEPFRASENYNRLSYNSAFPWQADGPNGEVAMNYVFKNQQGRWEPLRLFTFRRFEDGVYYRDAVLETNPQVKLLLADVPLPNGILRVDVNQSTDALALRLGHYALPNLTGTVRRSTRRVKGHTVNIIDNGTYQLALVPLQGWDAVEAVEASGLHPVSARSTVLNAVGTSAPSRPLLATLLLWKRSGEKWRKEELLPVRRLSSSDYRSITVHMADGSQRVVSYGK